MKLLGLTPEAWIAIAAAIIALASVWVARQAARAQVFALMVEMIDRFDTTPGIYDLDENAEDFDEKVEELFASTLGLLNALSACAIQYDGRRCLVGPHNYLFLYLSDAITERYATLQTFPDFEGLVIKTLTRPDPYRFLIKLQKRHPHRFRNLEIGLLQGVSP